ncbi:MAG: hypothetical protein CMK46_05900 [Porticoccus sp.]|nr:hypothetical protein [Porticoccus sp.]PHQ56647.1 MAG: hypothetical protein COA29_04050 [Porticoccus sp.]
MGETLKATGIVGLVIGFLGVALLSWSGFSDDNDDYLWVITWVLMAAIGTAVDNVLLKKEAGGAIAAPMAVQLLIDGTILLLASALVGEYWDVGWTIRFTASPLILSSLATAAMIFLWLGLLARAPLNQLNVFSFLTPVFGLLIGFLFFEERLQLLVQVLGILVVLVGIALMQEKDAVQNGIEEHKAGCL